VAGFGAAGAGDWARAAAGIKSRAASSTALRICRLHEGTETRERESKRVEE
jgi:hypothetical protein